MTTIIRRRSVAAWSIAASVLLGGSSAALATPALPEQAAAQPVLAPRAQPPVGDYSAQAKAAADYLKTQLKPAANTGDHFEVPDLAGKVGPNPDVTVDGLLAFDATGNNAERDRLGAWLNTQANVKTFVYTTGADGTQVVNPAAVAKLIIAAKTAKKADGTAYSPTNFAGYNLVALLETSQSADGTFNSNGKAHAGTYSQALAVLALSTAKPASVKLPAGAAVLRGAACPDQTVSWGLGSDKCTANSATDPDSTSLTLQALAVYKKATGRTDSDAMMTAGAKALAGKQVAKDASGQNALRGKAWVNTCKPGDWENKYFSANSTALSVQGIQAEAAPKDTVSTTARKNGLAWMVKVAMANPSKAFPACGQTGAADVRATVQGVQGLAQKTIVQIMA